MNYRVTPYSNEWGSGGTGGDCTKYTFCNKVEVCNDNAPCGSHCDKCWIDIF